MARLALLLGGYVASDSPDSPNNTIAALIMDYQEGHPPISLRVDKQGDARIEIRDAAEKVIDHAPD